MTDGSTPQAEDAYSRVDYRRLIAWGPRIQREGDFVLSLVEGAPERSVVDLGCGTGEHVAFLARQGCRAVGLDRSESMIEKAREHEARGEGRFLLGDACEADRVLAGEPPFGVALCLGNMLPHLTGPEDLSRFLQAAAGLLLPGGLLLVQILNYRRILDRGVRHLPLNFRPGEGAEEIVFLRLMRPGEGGSLLFFPTTLVLDPDRDPPVTVKGSRRVPLRAWTHEDLVPALESVGLEPRLHGDMAGGPYEPGASQDLVMVARRAR